MQEVNVKSEENLKEEEVQAANSEDDFFEAFEDDQDDFLEEN